MDFYVPALLLLFQLVRRTAEIAFPVLLSATIAVVFLPMVVLGTIGRLAWRRLPPAGPAGPAGATGTASATTWRSRWPSRRRWLASLWLVAALQYAGAALLFRADPLLLYLLIHLSLIGSVVLELGGQPAWSLWPVGMTAGTPAGAYVAALPAIVPGAVVAAHLLPLWGKLWPRAGRPGRDVRLAVEVPPRVAARAAGGIGAPAGGWGLGYAPDGRALHVADAEARHHTLVCGTPGAGKTTALGLVLEGVAARCPVVIIDGKASAALRRAVAQSPRSIIWTIGGDVRWDALRGDPTSFTGKLLAAESFPPQAGVYEAAAARYVQDVGRLLALDGRPRDPRFIAELLQPPALRRYIRHLHRRFGAALPPEVEDVTRTLEGMGHTEREGVAGFGARFGRFVKGTAGRSLGAGPGALVLEEAIRTGRTVLFSLDASGYPFEAAKIGAWLLLDLIAVAGQLQAESWVARRGAPAYVLVDELAGLAREGTHIVPLLARGREAGFACVVATQGLADLDRVGPAIGQQVLQNTAIKVVLRQGSARDAERWAGELGQYERDEVSRQVDDRGRSLGRHYSRRQAAPYVSADELRALGTGDAVLSVAPLGGSPRRLERLRVARPEAFR